MTPQERYDRGTMSRDQILAAHGFRPDRRYRRTVWAIRILGDLLAVVGAVAAICVWDSYPGAAFFFAVFAFGSLWIAADAGEEIRGWWP